MGPVSKVISTPLKNIIPVNSHRFSSLIHYCWLSLGLLLLLIFVIFLLSYFIATEKIKVNNQNFKNFVTSQIYKLPIVPKTPLYLLNFSLLAHQQTGHISYTTTVSATSKDFKQYIGNNEIDLQLQGTADLSPQNNFKFIFNVNNFDYLSGEINKIDNHWTLKDSCTLSPSTNKTFQDIYQIIIRDDSFKTLKLKDEYRLVYNPSIFQLEKINKIIARDFNLTESQKIQDLNIVFWIDSKTYLTNKILVSFNFISLDDSLPISQVSLAVTTYLTSL